MFFVFRELDVVHTQTLLSSGIHCLGGSDAPIEDCNPLMGLYDAIHRLAHSFKADQAARPSADDVFLPDERLTFSEALWLYTVSGAYGVREESRLGRIKVGYLADFVVLDRDVSSQPEQLLDARIEEVWVDGLQRLGSAVEQNYADSMLGGPFIPGKNGARRGAATGLLPGRRRAGGCCGR